MAEIFATAPFRKLLKGTGNRVSKDAAEALAEVTEEVGYLVIEEAANIASEKGRKTIREEDIIEAQRRLW